MSWHSNELRVIANILEDYEGVNDKSDNLRMAAAGLESMEAQIARLTAEVADLKTENIGLRRCEHADGQALRIAELRIAKLKAVVERLTPKPMTLQEACDVLNYKNHLYSKWEIMREVGSDGDHLVESGQGRLTAFEVFAIAEKYERDAGPIAASEERSEAR